MNIKDKLKWLDPFYSVDVLLEKYIGKPKTISKKIIYYLTYFIAAFLIASILYQIISLALGVEMPLAIVVSSSMEPKLHRGDVVILTRTNDLEVVSVDINTNIANKDIHEFANVQYNINENGLEQFKAIEFDNKTITIEEILDNDIVVYKSNINKRDIIHRAVVIINANDGNFILTKGDNNKTNRILDQDCKIDFNSGFIKNNCLNLFPIKLEDLKGKYIGKIPYIGYLKLLLFQ